MSVTLIFLLILFIYYCHHHNRTNQSHLSSCSSTLSPIQSSSHLSNPIRSLSLHSIVNKRQNHCHHQLLSTCINTKLTSLIHRRELLKTDSKYLQACFPFDNDSLYDIPRTSIHFLQEIGEGKRQDLHICMLFIDTKFSRKIWTNVHR